MDGYWVINQSQPLGLNINGVYNGRYYGSDKHEYNNPVKIKLEKGNYYVFIDNNWLHLDNKTVYYQSDLDNMYLIIWITLQYVILIKIFYMSLK
jgi:hypothetical protein